MFSFPPPPIIVLTRLLPADLAHKLSSFPPHNKVVGGSDILDISSVFRNTGEYLRLYPGKLPACIKPEVSTTVHYHQAHSDTSSPDIHSPVKATTAQANKETLKVKDSEWAVSIYAGLPMVSDQSPN